MIYLLLWLADVSLGLKFLLGLIFCFSVFIFMVMLVDDIWSYPKGVVKIVIIACLLSASLWILVPSRKTVYMITASYIGKQVSTKMEVDSKIGKLSKLIDIKLDEYIEGEIDDNKSSNRRF